MRGQYTACQNGFQISYPPTSALLLPTRSSQFDHSRQLRETLPIVFRPSHKEKTSAARCLLI